MIYINPQKLLSKPHKAKKNKTMLIFQEMYCVLLNEISTIPSHTYK